MTKTTPSRHSQRGVSAPGWIAIAAIFGFLLITFFRVFPMYYDNFKVISVLESIQQDQDIDPKSKRSILESISKRLHIQNVDAISRENIKISRKDGKTTIVVSYEIRANYVGNLFIGGEFVEMIVIER